MLTPMGHMTGEAIAVFRWGMRGAIRNPYGQIVVTDVAKSSRSLDQQGRQISGVRHVTRCTFAADKGTMLTPRDVDTHVHIVTVGTEFRLRRSQQSGNRRTVGDMASVTFSVLKRGMHDFCFVHTCHNPFMALGTQLVLIVVQQARYFRLMGIVAGHATSSYRRLVNNGHTQPLVYFVVALRTERPVTIRCQARMVGTVRNMTAHAIPVLERRVNH